MRYKYERGHPCYGCPYTFPTKVPSCTMGSNPRSCFWRYYKELIRNRKNNKKRIK